MISLPAHSVVSDSFYCRFFCSAVLTVVYHTYVSGLSVTVSASQPYTICVCVLSQCQTTLKHLCLCLVTVSVSQHYTTCDGVLSQCMCLVTVNVNQYCTSCVGVLSQSVLSQSVCVLPQWQSTLNHFCLCFVTVCQSTHLSVSCQSQ